eukprot:1572944-Prymnesium_polylepis.2
MWATRRYEVFVAVSSRSDAFWESLFCALRPAVARTRRRRASEALHAPHARPSVLSSGPQVAEPPRCAWRELGSARRRRDPSRADQITWSTQKRSALNASSVWHSQR